MTPAAGLAGRDALLAGHQGGHRDRGRRILRDLLVDHRDGLHDLEALLRDLLADEAEPDQHEEQADGRPAAVREPGGRHVGQRQDQRRENGQRVEEHAAVEIGHAGGRVHREVQPAVEHRAGEHERGEPGPRPLGVDLAGDHQAGEGVDHRAHDAEQVRRAPERDVEAEEPMPEIIDRRGQDGQGDTPGREVEAARPGETEDPQHGRGLRRAGGAARSGSPTPARRSSRAPPAPPPRTS